MYLPQKNIFRFLVKNCVFHQLPMVEWSLEFIVASTCIPHKTLETLSLGYLSLTTTSLPAGLSILVGLN